MIFRRSTTLRIGLLAIILSLAGSAAVLGFIRFATFNEHEGLAEALQRALWLSLFIATLFGTLSGYLIARFVGLRIEEVTRVADAVGAGNLSERAPVTGGGDAFDHLAQRINAMLDRIETLMGELRMLTDSLAHDLRSPVQRLRTRIEQALTSRDDAQRDHLLSGVLVEADTLMRTLTMVLEIGRSEAMTARSQFAMLDPSALIRELTDMYEPMADERGIALTFEAGTIAPINAHRQLLAQALSNLVDNAFAYSGGTAVTLFVHDRPESIEIGVADSGPGIAPENMAVALRRFGRIDQSRSTPGAGLGLSLVEAVAHLHSGTLTLSDNSPGLRATLRLPR